MNAINHVAHEQLLSRPPASNSLSSRAEPRLSIANNAHLKGLCGIHDIPVEISFLNLSYLSLSLSLSH